MTQVRIRHRRTGMFVARQDVPRGYGHGAGTISANWKWVRTADDATLFGWDTAIHPVIQLDLEGKVDFIAVDGRIWTNEHDIPRPWKEAKQ